MSVGQNRKQQRIAKRAATQFNIAYVHALRLVRSGDIIEQKDGTLTRNEGAK